MIFLTFMYFNYADGESDLAEVICEIWSDNEEEVLQDIEEYEVENAPVLEPDMRTYIADKKSKSLSIWLIKFLMVMQAIYHLSDNVISCFLSFFRVFFSVLGRFCKNCSDIAQYLPLSLYSAKLHENTLKFRKYVTCRKCHRIYFLSDCIEGAKNAQRSKTCPFRKFPSHTQARMRAPCETALLKRVELASGSIYFYPYLTYCYLSLQLSLQSFLLRPEFYEHCELWRTREMLSEYLSDVYDGKIWRDFQSFHGNSFLSEPGSLALMLNMDFFQPYKHIEYSVGAIYLTILNLPWHARYKRENVILVGLIPGPHEPHHDINSFLQPLVDELMLLWQGVEFNIHSSNEKKCIRCALLCIACDLPAGRKTCGFLSYNAHLGCSRCWKRFSGGVGSMDFSGFDRENWQIRNGVDHRQKAVSLLSLNTRSKLEKAESETGCRYSVLLQLPYFDAPRMMIVDPMHNLFLGSAKHFLKVIIIGKGLLSKAQFETLQKRVDSTMVPSGVGRIPCKIQTGFSSFTADQWKNWVIYFSLIALRDILSNDVLECWRHYVLACRALCTNQISPEKVLLADAHLLQFCKRAQHIFGRDVITPNMHMHCHLRECVLDYGPLHGFWLYPFERYNGILGAMPNNNRCIEVQIMKRFL